VEDAIRVFLVQLVDEGLFWGETELRGVYGDLVLLCGKAVERAARLRKEGEAVLTFTMDKMNMG
jgi:hypothetical protein